MKVSRYPLSIGFTGPIKPPRRSSHLIHSLVPDLEGLKNVINERSKPSEKGGKAKLGDYEKKWIGLAESVLSSQNLILATPPDSKKITEWGVRFPHCRSLVTTVENMLELSRCSRGPLRLPPILLAGPPGVGKTAVALELAKVLGVPSYTANMGQATAGFVLNGASLVWASGKSGGVLDLLLRGTGNPVMVLDELDKAGNFTPSNGANGAIADSILGLLEPLTSREFRDEALDWPVDASRVLWIATANDLSRVPDPLLSRFHVVEVSEPTREEMEEIIIPSLYRDILEEYNLTKIFPEKIPGSVARVLGQNPRTVRRRMIALLAKASGMNSSLLGEGMISDEQVGSMGRTMGFQAGR